MSVKHPNQPVIRDGNGVARFKQNDIVRYLLDSGASSLNSLAQMQFDNDDRNQLAQLLGFSVDGFAELDYADMERIQWADKQAETITREDSL